MDNQANLIADLKLKNTIGGVALVLSLIAIPIVAVEFYKFGFMQGGLEVIRYAQKAAELAAETAAKTV